MTSSTNSPRREFFRSSAGVWLSIALLLAAVALVYGNSLNGVFFYDDAVWVTRNPTIRQLWPPWEVVSPPAELGVSGRPLASYSFALSYALTGLNVRGYHLINILLHAGTALALFGVVRRSFQTPALVVRFGRDATLLALISALLWAAHPLASVVVNYVAQRTESLMALGYALTVYGFIRGVTSESSRWLSFSVVACFAGVMSKESMVTAPFVVLLYDRAFVAGTFAGAWRARWRYYLALASSWLLLAFLMVGLSQRGVGFGGEIPWWQFPLTQLRAILVYLKLAVWPANLSVDHGRALLTQLGAAVPYALLLTPLVITTVWGVLRNYRAAFLAAVFFIVLAPSSSVVPIVLQPIAENRVYLPLFALVTFGVLGCYRLAGLRGVAMLSLAIAACALGTRQRNTVFRAESTIWHDATLKFPQNARAHYNLGTALENEGREDAALAPYRRAVALDPTHYEAKSNLGRLIFTRGGQAEAEALYREALRLKPDFVEALVNLAILLDDTARKAEAVPYLQQALLVRADLPQAVISLGLILTQLGRFDEAAPQLEAVLRAKPGDGEAHYYLGIVRYQQQRINDATTHLARAAAALPHVAAPHQNLAAALLAANRPAEAIEPARRAIALDPQAFGGRYNLGLALLGTGAPAEALPELVLAARLSPQDPEVFNKLGVCLVQLGRTTEAADAFNRALQLNPAHADARANLERLRR